MSTTAKNLSGVFFAPSYNEMLPYMVEAYKSFQSEFDASTQNILMRIVTQYWVEYNETCNLAVADKFRNRNQGDFNIPLMLREIEIFCNLMNLAKDFKAGFSGTSVAAIGKGMIGSCGVKQLYTPCECTNPNKSIFAVALGSEVIKTADADCYATAGGYRCYESAEKPIVYLSVGHYGISLHVESYLTVDHYNNNICGVPTGNGTTTYKKEGKTVTRVISTKMYDLGEVLKKYNLEIKKVDCNRGIEILKEYAL